MQHLLQLGAGQPQSTLAPLHFCHLRPDGWLIEQRGDRLDFTRVCQAHEIASLTVSERDLLADWTCSGCEAERMSNHARARYVAAMGRLVMGGR